MCKGKIKSTLYTHITVLNNISIRSIFLLTLSKFRKPTNQFDWESHDNNQITMIKKELDDIISRFSPHEGSIKICQIQESTTHRPQKHFAKYPKSHRNKL